MRVVDCEQLSPEWWAARRGVPTASNFGKILTPKTLKPSASQDDFIAELIADLVDLTPRFNASCEPSEEMQHGINTEDEARSWYELERGVDVQRVGFCLTDDGRFGCSPDGLIGDLGGLELKCPSLKTQVRYLLSGDLPSEYTMQVHGSLIVTGRAYWDFLSYAPGFPPLLLRVEPDDYTEALRAALDPFWEKFQRAWATIQAAGAVAPIMAGN